MWVACVGVGGGGVSATCLLSRLWLPLQYSLRISLPALVEAAAAERGDDSGNDEEEEEEEEEGDASAEEDTPPAFAPWTTKSCQVRFARVLVSRLRRGKSKYLLHSSTLIDGIDSQ